MSGNYALKRRAVCSKRSEYTWKEIIETVAREIGRSDDECSVHRKNFRG